jgi:transketolase
MDQKKNEIDNPIMEKIIEACHPELDNLCVNTLRLLSVDAIQKANSGHPGLPLGAAAMAYTLWTRFLKFNPCNAKWPNRDRFIHSAGHGSALLYSLLHVSGYDLPLEELKRFRQWGSKTPGHPEYNPELGIECTTGPLGQGFAMGIGMAMAERFLAATYNKPDLSIMDHYTYAIVSDGDLMEGIASEAASIAGHLKLGKLIYLYDDNHISIEGGTDLTFTEDVELRFKSYDWHVQRIPNGNDIAAITSAILMAQQETEKPSLIMCRTNIGFGSPRQDSAKAHGEPLGEEHVKATKEKFDWPLEPKFHIPSEALENFRQAKLIGKQKEAQWFADFEEYRAKYPEPAAQFEQSLKGDLPDNWEADIPIFDPKESGIASRASSGKILNAIAKRIPHIIGGSADLAPSTKTIIEGSPDQSYIHPEGRNIRFGVREHAMGAIVNGLALHGGVIPYGATFLMFSDYMRPALRLAALMNTHSIFIFTHDSIAVGEDGPTHQPIEQIASMRAIPNLTVIRPADAPETTEAWRSAILRRRPVVLALTRQKLPTLDRERYASAKGLHKGAYIISDCDGDPDLLLIATGSEVSLALRAQERLLDDDGIKSRVISMPTWELFNEQSKEYQDTVLPPAIKKRLGIEAGSSFGWHKWIGDEGEMISVDQFGHSAPGSEVLDKYGFNVENVIAKAKSVIKK